MSTRASSIVARECHGEGSYPSFSNKEAIYGMAMNKTIARFDGYELRGVSFDRDAQQLGNWLARDPLHQHLLPAFFLGLLENDSGSMRVDPRPTCYAMEDEFGAIFYIRLERAARVNIQFDPIRQSVVDRARVARSRRM